ncbi:rab-GTPase-TBC domain-containing protein, partial [Zopfochytrium polystomum]
QIKGLCREGIPDSCRGRAWFRLAGCHTLQDHAVYENLLAREPLPIYNAIEKDIGRCFPDHIMFHDPNGQGQSNLRTLLRAYAHYNPSVGYCQGMGMLAGLMLMYLPPADAFWLLVATLGDARFALGLHEDSLRRLQADSKVFDGLLAGKARRLAKHLASQEVQSLIYLPQWLLTMFTVTLPWPSVLRVWDMFFCEGIKVLFRVTLAIMLRSQNHLLHKCPSGGEIMSYLLHLPPAEFPPDVIVRDTVKVRIKGKVLQRLRESAAAAL